MVTDVYTITDVDPILSRMADTNQSIWYRCIPTKYKHPGHKKGMS